MRWAKWGGFWVAWTLFITLGWAQDSVITAETANQLVPIQAWGSALPLEVAFSPDGQYLMAGTTEETLVYRLDDLNAELYRLPAVGVEFDENGLLISGGRRWNLTTGQSVGIEPTVRSVPSGANRPTTRLVGTLPDGSDFEVDTDFPTPVLASAFLPTQARLAAVVDDPESRDHQILFYDLISGEQYAVFPESHPELRYFDVVKTGEERYTLVSDFWQAQGGSGMVSLYDVSAETHPLLLESMRSDRGVTLSPDGKTIVYDRVLDERTEQSRWVLHVIGDGIWFEVPYAFTCSGCEPAQYWVGNHHLAVWLGDTVTVYPFDRPDSPIRLPSSTGYPGSLVGFSQDERFFADEREGIVTIWDLQSPSVPLTRLNFGLYWGWGYFNHDLSRYSARSADGWSVKSSADNTVWVELPREAVLNASMTQAAWWKGGTLHIWQDGMGETTIPAIEGYLGAALALNPANGRALFGEQETQVLDLTTAESTHYTLPNPPTSAQFTADGSRFLALRSEETTGFRDGFAALWAVGSSDPVMFTAGGWFDESIGFSPTGDYTIIKNDVCDWRGDVFMNIYKTNRLPDSGANLMTVYGGCGESPVSFPSLGNMAYIGAVDKVWRVDLDTLDESADTYVDGYSQPYVLIDYESPSGAWWDGSRMRAIAVSGDERWLAVVVESLESYRVMGIYVEVFDLNNQPTDISRSAWSPSLVIEGATSAAISPDGRYIVTETGVYLTSGDRLDSLIPPTDITHHAFSPDGQLLATYHDSLLSFWNLGALDEVLTTPSPSGQYEVAGVLELGFSADQTALYMRRAGEVQVWGVR